MLARYVIRYMYVLTIVNSCVVKAVMFVRVSNFYIARDCLIFVQALIPLFEHV